MIIKKGKTDVITYFNLVDSAAGTPETGLTITNIDATYTRAQAAAVKNDLTALAAATTAHTDNRGIEVDATNAPGLYRIDWPDAAFATGVDRVILTVTCSGCAPAHLIVELVDYDPVDGVRLGLTALPNAAADAAGGLVISDAGGFDVDNRAPAAAAVTNMNVVFNTDFATNYSTTTDKWQVEANVLLIEGSDATNQIRDSIVDDATRIDASALNTLSSHDPGETIMGATDLGTGSGLTSLAPSATALSTAQWTNTRAGYLDNINNATLAGASFPTDPADASVIAGRFDTLDTSVGDLPTNAEFNARTLAAASYATAAAQTTAQNDLDILTGADGVTLATSQPNYAPATAAALAALVTTVGAAGAGLTEAGGTGDQFTAIPWNAAWDAEVQSEVTDALNAALTEAYRSAGATGSVAQLLYEIIAHLGNSAIASTTKTLKKLDGTTTAKTYTLNDATNPTAIEETT